MSVVAPSSSSSTSRAPVPVVDILRFNTCGSVDDGKSTLIGRLLYDSKSLMEDQIEALERSADITGGGQINLANLTDGLRAEREQGITIDVAYRYFATPKRKFIIAEIAAARVTERGSRADDKASEAAMEDRKKAGYF